MGIAQVTQHGYRSTPKHETQQVLNKKILPIPFFMQNVAVQHIASSMQHV